MSRVPPAPSRPKTKPKRRRGASRLWAGAAWLGTGLCATAFFGTDRFWVGTLIGSVPVLAWFIGAALCLLAVPKFRWPGWMIFTPIWLVFGLLTALPGRLEPVKDGELVVRVLTWNIDHIGGDVGAFASLLKAADADVICLQEASDRENYGFRQLNQLVREMPNYRLEIEGDNAILSRVPIKSKERLEIPIQHYRRFVPLVTISTPKGDLTVANIHLVQGFWPGWAMHPRGLPGMLRDMQSQRETQVEVTLKALRTRPASLILAGDFNLQPFGALQTRLDGELNDASAGSVFASTFPTPTPLYRIDRIWTSSDLRPVKRSIIASGLSSHRPVVVDFVVR